ncbi:MAG: hypothetical protein PHH47_11180 [Gallionella sp.]|nr:hypothetical protein [Gallionella sp.]MDD4947003.1 hypothetical protein [Gallionella sp.]
MNAQLHNLINRQHQRMRELRDDARDLASTVADEVWDKFEVEIEEATSDGYIFDGAGMTKISLASTLAMNYDEAFERNVLGFFERQQQELKNALPDEAGFYDSRLDLAGLRKGLKLRRHADEMIGKAIEEAKPGLIGMIFACTDPTSDDWDKEHIDNARRLRERLLGLRSRLLEMMVEETANVVRAARLAYIGWLDTLPGKLDAHQAAAVKESAQ